MRTVRRICSFITAVGSLLLAAPGARAQRPDSTIRHQLRIGLDLSRPVLSAVVPSRQSYEVQVDYALPKDRYAVLEAGWGRSEVDYADLQYTASNSFVRIGVDKSLLQRLFPGDWDAAIAGIRYGFAPVSRGEARYATTSTVWNNVSGTIPAESLTYHWAELTGGIRVALGRHLVTGWNVRGKFLFNGNNGTDLRPSYVAGYGKGDRNTIFDFNVWLLYALRW